MAGIYLFKISWTQGGRSRIKLHQHFMNDEALATTRKSPGAILRMMACTFIGQGRKIEDLQFTLYLRQGYGLRVTYLEVCQKTLLPLAPPSQPAT
jgi:hypothetical protein